MARRLGALPASIGRRPLSARAGEMVMQLLVLILWIALVYVLVRGL